MAARLGIGSPETVRKWLRRAQVDAGERPGLTSEEKAEIKALKQEVSELRRANEILKAASAFSRPARPATAVLVMFISKHKDAFGVEPVCRVLTGSGWQIARAPTMRPSGGCRRRGPCGTRRSWPGSGRCARSMRRCTAPARRGWS